MYRTIAHRLTGRIPAMLTTALVFAGTTFQAAERCQAAEKNVGNLLFRNNYSSTIKVYLHHRNSPDRVWKKAEWRIAGGKTTHLSVEGRRIKIRGDWRITIASLNGKRSKKRRISSVGVHGSDGKWHVFASNVKQGSSPKAKLPISASRGASSWTIDARGVVTSRIKYTVGSGSGSKKYTSGLIVEFSNGSIYTAWSTKTVGRPAFGTRKGTHTDQSHTALPLNRLGSISRVYVKYSTSSSGPNTIREWINEARQWARDGEKIYKELKDNELVKDAVKYYAGT